MTFVCTSWWPLHVSVETCWYKYYSLIFIYTDVIILNIFYTFKFYLPTTAVIWRVPAQNKLFQYNRKTHLFSEHFCSRRGHAYICKVHRRLLSNLHHKGPPPLIPHLQILSCCQSNTVPPRPDFVVLCVSAIRLKLTFTIGFVFTTYVSSCKQNILWVDHTEILSIAVRTGRLRLKHNGTCAETRFRLSP